MAEEKESTSIPLSQAENGGEDPEDPVKSPPTSSASSTRQACCYVLQSWISKKFMTGCVVLFPVAVTFFITWWFVQFVDGFFSPLYEHLGFDIFDQNTTAFKEVAIIRHPRVGEYAFGFITSTVTLQVAFENLQFLPYILVKLCIACARISCYKDNGDEELCSVFVPTNHLYIGDIFLVSSKEIIRPNLSIREGIEIIVSGGMTMPQVISPIERVARQGERIPLNRIM
ncbi:protein like cov 2 [Citrus sinensis]|nr:protein like cov 2 [Citrus sinensis]